MKTTKENEPIAIPFDAQIAQPRGRVKTEIVCTQLGSIDAMFALQITRPGGAIEASRPRKVADLMGFLIPGGTGLPSDLRDLITTCFDLDPRPSDEVVAQTVACGILIHVSRAWDALWQRQRRHGVHAPPPEATLPDHPHLRVRYQPLAWGEWIAFVDDTSRAGKPGPIRISLVQLRQHLDRTPEVLPPEFVAFAKGLRPETKGTVQIVKVGTQILNGAPEKAR